MVRLEHSVVINRPIEEVFEFVATFENRPKWITDILEARQTSEGPVGVGATSTVVAQFLGRRFETSFEVTEYEPNRKVCYKATSGPVEGGTKYSQGYTRR